MAYRTQEELETLISQTKEAISKVRTKQDSLGYGRDDDDMWYELADHIDYLERGLHMCEEELYYLKKFTKHMEEHLRILKDIEDYVEEV